MDLTSTAGACHSDEFIMGLSEEAYVYGLPLTLGHEGAGIVDEVGAGVTAVKVGDSVAVYGPWDCGVCPACAKGAENYCHVAAERGIVPPGLGAPGAMAEYMLVDHERHLVPPGDLDPVENVSLTDAGLTPYHAIKPSLIRALNGGRGATAVFDFVGIEPTTSLAAKLTHHDSEIVIVGVGAGAVPVGIFTLPWETKARAPYWGSRSELFEVFDLARSGMIHVETERFSLDDAPKAYERMHAGTLRGRAVIVP